jgi:glycosyltransferase involved in cell wall biosynthesis
MKILWVSPFFLHPTDRGAQIRSLGMLKQLHLRHEVHFAALSDPESTEGKERSREYCTQAYDVPHRPPERGSPAFLVQAIGSVFSSDPLAVSRYDSPELRRIVSKLTASGGFDAVVCDFLASAPNIADLGTCVLFEHNVETTIWERHLEQAQWAPKRLYFKLQARRMFEYERYVCQNAAHVVAVSPVDAERMRQRFQVSRVTDVPTGVDLDYFRFPGGSQPAADLVFTGSMDWLPNIDGIKWFVKEILPVIRQKRPNCTVVVAGRRPVRDVEELASQYSGVTVTGTVPDIRPYLWGSSIAIVPLRIGGGTRLKIYESMAAGVPVVSTTVGAEGLACHNGRDIVLADSAAAFAGGCLELLEQAGLRRRIADEALDLVARQFSWAAAARSFEEILRTRMANSS